MCAVIPRNFAARGRGGRRRGSPKSAWPRRCGLSASESAKTAFVAPRALNAPTFCRFSHLKKRWAPCERVESLAGHHRCAVYLTLDPCTGFVNEVPRETSGVAAHAKRIARGSRESVLGQGRVGYGGPDGPRLSRITCVPESALPTETACIPNSVLSSTMNSSTFVPLNAPPRWICPRVGSSISSCRRYVAVEFRDGFRERCIREDELSAHPREMVFELLWLDRSPFSTSKSAVPLPPALTRASSPRPYPGSVVVVARSRLRPRRSRPPRWG